MNRQQGEGNEGRGGGSWWSKNSSKKTVLEEWPRSAPGDQMQDEEKTLGKEGLRSTWFFGSRAEASLVSRGAVRGYGKYVLIRGRKISG